MLVITVDKKCMSNKCFWQKSDYLNGQWMLQPNNEVKVFRCNFCNKFVSYNKMCEALHRSIDVKYRCTHCNSILEIK